MRPKNTALIIIQCEREQTPATAAESREEICLSRPSSSSNIISATDATTCICLSGLSGRLRKLCRRILLTGHLRNHVCTILVNSDRIVIKRREEKFSTRAYVR